MANVTLEENYRKFLSLRASLKGTTVHLTRRISPDQYEWRNEDYSTYRQHTLLTYAEHLKYWEHVESSKTIEMFGIEAIKSGLEPISVGTCGLTSISYPHGTAEYSILIAKKYRGLGFASIAVRELLRRAFFEFRLNLVEGHIFANNEGGIRVAERCGLTQEARLRSRYFKNGQFLDVLIYSIKKNEWK